MITVPHLFLFQSIGEQSKLSSVPGSVSVQGSISETEESGMMKDEDEELRLRLEAQRVMDEMMKGRHQAEDLGPRRE